MTGSRLERASRASQRISGARCLLLRTTSQELEVKLTDDERLQRGDQLANLQEEREAEERRQADIKQQMKQRLAAFDARISELAIVVRRREEMRQVQVEEWAYFDSNVVARVRTDTGEEVARRPLTDEERQQFLPGLEEDNGEQA